MSVRLNEYTLGAVIGLAVCALAVLKVIYFPKGLPIDQKWLDLGYVTIYLSGSLAALNWRFRKNSQFWFLLSAFCIVHWLAFFVYFRGHDRWPIRVWALPVIIETIVFVYAWQCILQKSLKPRRFL